MLTRAQCTVCLLNIYNDNLYKLIINSIINLTIIQYLLVCIRLFILISVTMSAFVKSLNHICETYQHVPIYKCIRNYNILTNRENNTTRIHISHTLTRARTHLEIHGVCGCVCVVLCAPVCSRCDSCPVK